MADFCNSYNQYVDIPFLLGMPLELINLLRRGKKYPK